MATNAAITTVNTNDNKIIFEANWDLFIVPNPAVSLVDDYMPLYYAKKQIQALYKIEKANNCSIGIKDQLVQVWYCNEQCENGTSHDPYVVDQDGRVWDISFDFGGYLPEPIVRELHEGETSIINIPVTLKYHDAATKIVESRNAIMEAHITPKQKAYRYREFGTFEEALKRVLL